ncbi:MAG: hypothetical protein ACRYGM_04080, partial [Janthinobacterium lividum]
MPDTMVSAQSDLSTALHPTGVFSAACTPMCADLTPDHAAFVQHCRHLLANGCHGVAMLGTTG